MVKRTFRIVLVLLIVASVIVTWRKAQQHNRNVDRAWFDIQLNVELWSICRRRGGTDAQCNTRAAEQKLLLTPKIDDCFGRYGNPQERRDCVAQRTGYRVDA